ncbi:MFS transporter [Photobacterium makurazakiensis]|uniref:MFS transporter n=1 Tax=Photobacterium makurazakiensis TaxID=2910234 RepID=UPI003D142D9D
MNKHTTVPLARNTVWVPILGLSLFAIASGYLMSLLPLSLGQYQLPKESASWLASVYYLGLLFGSMFIEPVIKKVGHQRAFVIFMILLFMSVITMIMLPSLASWLFARFIAGMAVAGVFVVIESWLLIGDNAKERAKNLGLYMTSLYGGTTIGQFGVGTVGIEGVLPFVTIATLLIIAMLPVALAKNVNPICDEHQSLSMRKILALSKPAIIGCLVSGMVMGSIYGLLPLALKVTVKDNHQISVLMAITVLGGMLIQPIVGKVSNLMSKSLLLAAFSLLGVFAMGLYLLDPSYSTQVIALAILGMSAFALYPVAITLACDGLASSAIVSATQVMLFSYSVGSATGPLVANEFMKGDMGLMGFFFSLFLATAIYMLLVSARTKPRIVAS